jgi:SAM-dependent methyltransferase
VAELAQVNDDFAASDSLRWRARFVSRPEPYGEVAHIDLDALGVAPSSRILDLGCGNGQFTLPLLARKLAVVSMDLDTPRLREVRESCLEEGLEGRVVRANGSHLPCSSQSLDVVVCREMIEHIHEPGAVLDEIRRILRPDGRLCVTVPSAHTERFFQWVDPRWLAMAGHVHVFTREAMCDLLARHGFEVTEVRGRNFFYSFFWFVHTLVRTTHDGTGRIQDHFALARRVFRFWRMLGEGRLKRGIERVGNAVFPKSNVYYCVKTRRE